MWITTYDKISVTKSRNRAPYPEVNKNNRSRRPSVRYFAELVPDVCPQAVESGQLMQCSHLPVTVCRTGGDLTAAEMKGLQHARLDKLTVNLTIILKRWVAGDCDGFKVRQTGLVTHPHTHTCWASWYIDPGVIAQGRVALWGKRMMIDFAGHA